MKYGLEKITHALTSHLIWQSFPTTLVLLGLGGGVLFTSAWLNLHTRDPNSCWPPSATTTGIGRQSTGAGRGSCSKTLVALRCLAISPGVSCQRMWAVHTYKHSSSSHNNSICVIHQIGSNAPLGERRIAFFWVLICSQNPLKTQDIAAGEPSSPGFRISRPSPSSPRIISPSSEHRGHFAVLNSITRASG